MPGEEFDGLLGPWVDQTIDDQFRVSPLVSNSGSMALAGSEAKRTHAAIALQLTTAAAIRADQFDAIFLHGLLGEEASALMKLTMATMLTTAEQLGTIAEHASVFLRCRTDRPIYVADAYVSIQLRVQQAILLLAANKTDAFSDAWLALEMEFNAFVDQDAISSTYLLACSKALLQPGFADAFPDFHRTILKVCALGDAAGVEFTSGTISHGATETRQSFAAFVFAFQISHINSIDALVSVFEQVSGATADDRELLFGSLNQPEFGGSVVKSAWVQDRKSSDYDSRRAAKASHSR